MKRSSPALAPSVLFFLAFFAQNLLAQGPFEHLPTRFCAFENARMPSEIDLFDPEPSVEARVAKILQCFEEPQNFKLRAANVGSATAAFDEKKERWILYSKSFFNDENVPEARKIAALAHEIAHLALGHDLRRPLESEAEIDADDWMGYALFWIGFTRNEAQKALFEQDEAQIAALNEQILALEEGLMGENSALEFVKKQIATIERERPSEKNKKQLAELKKQRDLLQKADEKALEQKQKQLAELRGQREKLAQTDRRAAFDRGFSRAETKALVAKAHGFEGEKKAVALQGLTEFKLPVPTASADYELADWFNGCQKMADADQKIRRALEANGYSSRRYYYVDGGFALVTRIEQFKNDGSRLPEDQRWSDKLARDPKFSPTAMLERFLWPQAGRFRLFAFVVTAKEVIQKAPETEPDKNSVNAWLERGGTKLPRAIGETAFADARVLGLVYEFEVKETDQKKPRLVPRSAVAGRAHLEKSGILNGL